MNEPQTSRVRVWPYALLFLAAFAAFLILQWPAAYGYRLAETHLPPEVALEGLHGTIWVGGAEKVRVGDVVFEHLDWRIEPWAAWRGAVRLDWSLRGGHDRGRGRVILDRQGVALDATRVNVEMGTLERLAGGAPVALGGHIALDLDAVEVSWEGRIRSATGRGQWQEAHMLAPAAAELGAFEATLETRNGVIVAEFQDQGGPVGADGALRLEPDGNYDLEGRAWAAETAGPGQREALRALGHHQPGEPAPFRVSGQL